MFVIDDRNVDGNTLSQVLKIVADGPCVLDGSIRTSSDCCVLIVSLTSLLKSIVELLNFV